MFEEEYGNSVDVAARSEDSAACLGPGACGGSGETAIVGEAVGGNNACQTTARFQLEQEVEDPPGGNVVKGIHLIVDSRYQMKDGRV